MKVSPQEMLGCLIQQLIGGQWVLDTVVPDKKDEKVKEKQLDALKRMGHHALELDEFESACLSSMSVVLGADCVSREGR